LERLSAYFWARDGDAVRRRREFLLYGMGGSGKSQIALKFAQEYGQRLVPLSEIIMLLPSALWVSSVLTGFFQV
jgi:hypothetical protein